MSNYIILAPVEMSQVELWYDVYITTGSVYELEVLSAKAERGLPPVSERERERERQTDRQTERERERERDSLIYTGTVMIVNMLIKLWSVLKRCHFYFFFMTSNSKIRRDERP